MADILIRGMEMPEYCYECPCHNGESGYCQAYKSGYLGSIERPAKCPFVPLPEGHGRLIDADKLTPDMGYFITGGSGTVGSMCSLPAYSQQNIDNAPTIVPAEGGDK